MKKKFLKDKKAITLITLVITIIIMLILSGIVLSLTLGDKTLFDIAKNVANKYKTEEENEQLQLNSLYRELASFDTGGNIKIEELSEIVEKIIENKLLSTYPIGSIYISENETNPSEFIGGKWEKYGEGRTLVGEGTGTDINSRSKNFKISETGGEYSHVLQESELASHAHVGLIYSSEGKTISLQNAGTGYQLLCQAGGGVSKDIRTEYAGGSQAHNNIQPYVTVYMWKRIN